MNQAGIGVMQEFRDVILGYGQSDEYSFVFRRSTDAFNRRSSKLLSYVCSLFTSVYVKNWDQWFSKAEPMQYPPCFDARIVLYPTDENLRDYLSWRQADTHVNNLYNTAFWSLVQEKGLTNQQAEEKLRGTLSGDKNEMLFSEFQINYNEISPLFRKGTILMRKQVEFSQENDRIKRQLIVPFHCDLIRDKFWKEEHPELLAKNAKKLDTNVMQLESLPDLLQIQINSDKSV